MNIDKIIKAGDNLLKSGSSQEKIVFMSKLKKVMETSKRKSDYENAMQLALKLVINGAYGAFANQWFCFFNNDLAASITSTCRDLTQLMDAKNSEYWYTLWHKDVKLHEHLGISNPLEIPKDDVVSVYGDSITGDSIIRTENGEISIEDLYNSCNESTNRTDKEVLVAYFNSLNWTEEKGYHYSKVKNIIRHKVSKKKWKLKTKTGKEIIVTNDHSMIVFRDGNMLEVKPSEIIEADKVLICNGNILPINKEFDEIESIECIGSFEDEYVYDLEMDDNSHTFIANDILVHNTDSIFVSFDAGMKSCNWEEDGKDPMDFINKVHEFRLIKFFVKALDKFANDKGVENIEDFELEKISESMLLIEKKNYMQNIVMEDGISYDSLTYFQAKGIETVRSSTPPFARERVMDAIKYLFKNPDTYNIKEMLKIVQDLKKEFEFAPIEEISMMTSMNKYNEKVLNDGRIETPCLYNEATSQLELTDDDYTRGGHKRSDDGGKSLYVKDTLEIVKGAHFSVKAVGVHNFLLSKNDEHRLKYDFIKSGNKVKYYYTTDDKYPVFAYMPGEYPIEIAPPMDYNLQFEKCMLSIINRFVKVLGMPEINKRVSVIMPLFSKL